MKRLLLCLLFLPFSCTKEAPYHPVTGTPSQIAGKSGVMAAPHYKADIAPIPETTPAPQISGLPANYGVVSPGQITRSSQPDAAGFAALAQSGVKTVLKLDLESEFPAGKEQKLIAGKMALWNSPLNYIVVDCKKAHAIADELQKRISKGDVVHIHCKRGIDRTGLIVGLWQMKYQHKTYQQIQGDWRTYGTPALNMRICLKR